MVEEPLVPPTIFEAYEPGITPVSPARVGVVIDGMAADYTAGMVEDVFYSGLVPDEDLCTPPGKEPCNNADCERVSRGGVQIR